MTNEQKMAYLVKALDLGAYVDVNIHLQTKEEAEKTISELSKMVGLPYEEKGKDLSSWFKINDPDNKLSIVVFFNKNNSINHGGWIQ